METDLARIAGRILRGMSMAVVFAPVVVPPAQSDLAALQGDLESVGGDFRTVLNRLPPIPVANSEEDRQLKLGLQGEGT